jgi:hypothetical protein
MVRRRYALRQGATRGFVRLSDTTVAKELPDLVLNSAHAFLQVDFYASGGQQIERAKQRRSVRHQLHGAPERDHGLTMFAGNAGSHVSAGDRHRYAEPQHSVFRPARAENR